MAAVLLGFWGEMMVTSARNALENDQLDNDEAWSFGPLSLDAIFGPGTAPFASSLGLPRG